MNFTDYTFALVDDSQCALDSLETALKALNCKNISIFSSGQSFLNAVNQGASFNFVFCDFIMPEMNGIQVLGAFREKVKKDQTKFILLTSTQSRATVVEFVSKGGDAYLKKPVSSKSIENTLGKLI